VDWRRFLWCRHTETCHTIWQVPEPSWGFCRKII
jgi:hypothetical protein